MDEKTIAALREVFEVEYVRHMNSQEIAGTWGQRDYTFEEIAAMREGNFYNVGVAGVGQYHGYLNGCWWGFLACYQHLAPMVVDAERYRAIRQCGREWSNLCVFDSRGALIADKLDREADTLINAAREQGKKTC